MSPPPPRSKRNTDSQPAGVSMIIAIIFVGAFLLVMAGLYQAQMAGMASVRNHDMEGKIRYLAKSAEELSRLMAQSNGVGWNSGPNDPDVKKYQQYIVGAANDEGLSTCKNDGGCVQMNVMGRSSATVNLGNAPYYPVPMAYTQNNKIVGSGDAADKCQNSADADDPCHWNKITLGQNIEIPLYYDDGGINKDNNNVLLLRVRSPRCGDANINAVFCDRASKRIILYPQVSKNLNNPNDPFASPNDDPVLVQWLITDLDSQNVLVASDRLDKKTNKRSPLIGKIQNTEISGGRINSAFMNNFNLSDLVNFKMWDTSKSHEGRDINDSISPYHPINSFLTNLKRPILHLSLVTQPKKIRDNFNKKMSDHDLNDPSLNVPYLEYQILSKSPIADSKSVISGFIEVGDFRKEVKAIRKSPSSGGGFAIENL